MAKGKDLSEAGLFVFKARYEHLNFLKRQQWIITTYIAAIYGALLSVRHILLKGASLSNDQVWLLKGAALLAGAVGIIGLLVVQYDIGETRKAINTANEYIFGKFNKDDKTEREKIIREPYKHPYRRGVLFLLAVTIFLIGGAVLVWRFI